MLRSAVTAIKPATLAFRSLAITPRALPRVLPVAPSRLFSSVPPLSNQSSDQRYPDKNWNVEKPVTYEELKPLTESPSDNVLLIGKAPTKILELGSSAAHPSGPQMFAPRETGDSRWQFTLVVLHLSLKRLLDTMESEALTDEEELVDVELVASASPITERSNSGDNSSRPHSLPTSQHGDTVEEDGASHSKISRGKKGKATQVADKSCARKWVSDGRPKQNRGQCVELSFPLHTASLEAQLADSHRGRRQGSQPSEQSGTTYPDLSSSEYPHVATDLSTAIYASVVKDATPTESSELAKFLVHRVMDARNLGAQSVDWKLALPAMARELTSHLVDSSLAACFARLPAFTMLIRRLIPYDLDSLADSPLQVTIAVLCAMGARSSPHSALLGIPLPDNNSASAALLLTIGDRREKACRALSTLAWEKTWESNCLLGGKGESKGRPALEAIIGLAHFMILENIRMKDTRWLVRIAVGLYEDLQFDGDEDRRNLRLEIGPLLFGGDAILSAQLGVPCLLSQPQLAEFFDPSGKVGLEIVDLRNARQGLSRIINGLSNRRLSRTSIEDALDGISTWTNGVQRTFAMLATAYASESSREQASYTPWSAGETDEGMPDPLLFDLSLPDGHSFQFSNFGDTIGDGEPPPLNQVPNIANGFQGQNWIGSTDAWSDGANNTGLSEGANWVDGSDADGGFGRGFERVDGMDGGQSDRW
ncbi:hypothetical protein P7C70_g4221, partial [Phenoliferia sp. Uapishka_3]